MDRKGGGDDAGTSESNGEGEGGGKEKHPPRNNGEDGDDSKPAATGKEDHTRQRTDTPDNKVSAVTTAKHDEQEEDEQKGTPIMMTAPSYKDQCRNAVRKKSSHSQQKTTPDYKDQCRNVVRQQSSHSQRVPSVMGIPVSDAEGGEEANLVPMAAAVLQTVHEGGNVDDPEMVPAPHIDAKNTCESWNAQGPVGLLAGDENNNGNNDNNNNIPEEIPRGDQQEQPDDESGRNNDDSRFQRYRNHLLVWWLVTVVAIVVLVAVAAAVLVVLLVDNSGGGGTAPPAPSPSIVATTLEPSGGGTAEGGTAPPTLSSSVAATTLATTTLEQIRLRGLLRCGILDVTIQGETVPDGTDPIGFNEDMCKAVAAAIFGSATDRVEYAIVSPSNRFMELDAGNVDLLAGSVTHTMERQVYEPTTETGFAFSIPYLYGGLTFGGIPPYGACADELRNDDGSATSSTTDCSGLKICLINGTTFAKLVPDLIPGVSVESTPNVESFYRWLREGRCNVLAGDQFETASTMVERFAFFGDYEQGLDLHSKEPLSLVTRQDDPTWSDFVNWVVQGLLSAEEQKITQDLAHLFVKSKLFGDTYENMFIDAVKEVGHYGELYERHLEAILPRKPINMINDGTSGLIYAMPFGDVNPRGPDPVAGSTLQMIQERGHLNCGVSRRAIFAKFDERTNQYSGFDVDFCRALAAAIFGGVANVVYTDLMAKDRFTALQTGVVDVLSRITTVTLSPDVLEPSTEAGFSFSQPNFYDGVGFGGIPPFGVCADTQKTSNECADLRICVNDATTSLATVQQLFPERFIVVKGSGDLAAQGLTTGECNAIAGGVFDVMVSNIRDTGNYTGDYEQGKGQYSKDPLALVTREDDPQWSAFVYWIVSAIFYAEEEGITFSDSFKMLTVNLFGNVYFKMLKLAVEAVGSYAEIYDRHVEEEFARSGLNLLNSHPLQAQHYPLPGLQL